MSSTPEQMPVKEPLPGVLLTKEGAALLCLAESGALHVIGGESNLVKCETCPNEALSFAECARLAMVAVQKLCTKFSDISDTEKIKIRMLQNVRSDLIFGMQLGKPGTILRCGMEYPGTSNKNGAICGICDNGELLGVKPGEFEFVEAPEWVLKIWEKHGRGEARP